MTFIKVPCPTTSTHVCPIGLNNVMRKNAPNQCAWTKFQPPIWLLALSGPIFLFQPLNQLSLQMALSKNKLAKSSPIIKYAPGQSFSLLRGSWLCQDPFSCFGHYRLYYPKKTDQIFTHLKNMPLDQVSASYMALGSVRTHFPVSATKQTIPIDGAIQK